VRNTSQPVPPITDEATPARTAVAANAFHASGAWRWENRQANTMAWATAAAVVAAAKPD
jgi:hypothetical protein